jgi:hypothetical protein
LSCERFNPVIRNTGCFEPWAKEVLLKESNLPPLLVGLVSLLLDYVDWDRATTELGRDMDFYYGGE